MESLYKIEELKFNQIDQSIFSRVSINQHHGLFNGHFPQFPILPGVSMIQILKDILQQATGFKLTLFKAENIKYLSLVQPNDVFLNYDIQFVAIDSNLFKVSNTIKVGETICMKLSGIYLKK